TPTPRRFMSVFTFLSSPPAAAITIRALEVTITRRCRRLGPPPVKNLENFLGASVPLCPLIPPLPSGDRGAGAEVTVQLPSLRIRSLDFVRTGDHSISS